MKNVIVASWSEFVPTWSDIVADQHVLRVERIDIVSPQSAPGSTWSALSPMQDDIVSTWSVPGWP
jgi:hypothetical protein